MDIAKIVAVPGADYWQNFVYVECRPLPQIGLYNDTPEDIERRRRLGLAYEEYAVCGHQVFTRDQYDDGGYVANGRVRRFRRDPDIRLRYVAPYNFIISSKMFPANVASLDDRLTRMLDACLENPAAFNKLVAWILTLPKRPDRGED
ncbi:MAG: hypothetical protein WDM91_17465 [Rhizomicrobium sp.]